MLSFAAKIYVKGLSIINELIQNSDDSKSTTFKLMLNTKTYNSSTIMSQGMSEW